MARETGARTARAVAAEAERAALGLVRQRTALVGAASAAQHERDEAAAALERAEAVYAEAYRCTPRRTALRWSVGGLRTS
jgi:hypothetical protein